MTFAKGYKTYICAAIGAALGVYQAMIQYGFHLPPVPSFALWILGAAGLYSTRNGITTDTQKAVSDILNQITVAPPASVDVGQAGMQATTVAATQHFATSKNSTA